jgi:hypothetical protein
MDREIIMKALMNGKQQLEDMGFKVAYLSLYGSQNYGLDINNDEYQSDIDMKAIIVPNLDDLVNNSKPVSIKVMCETGEIDVKDIRIYMEILMKGNPTYIETLFTDYYIIDDDFKVEMEEMLSKREELVFAMRMQMLKSIYGMMLEKEKALCHPYPTIAWKIDKWGFDGKQLSHMYRFLCIMLDYFYKNLPYKQCLKPDNEAKAVILRHKLNEDSLEDAKKCSDIYIKEAKSFKGEILAECDETKIDCSIKEYYLDLSKKIIKNKIDSEIIRAFVLEMGYY